MRDRARGVFSTAMRLSLIPSMVLGLSLVLTSCSTHKHVASSHPNGKPEAGTDISRRVELLGDLDDAQRQRLLLVANACPIHKVLTGEVRIDTALLT